VIRIEATIELRREALVGNRARVPRVLGRGLLDARGHRNVHRIVASDLRGIEAGVNHPSVARLISLSINCSAAATAR
jgi:hypothetical protein